jgi:hypothetical protein
MQMESLVVFWKKNEWPKKISIMIQMQNEKTMLNF